DAVAYLGRITAAARSPEDRRALRIGRTNAVTARAELRRIADTGGRSAHGSGRQDRVGRTEERSVAGTVLLDVARAGGRTADERRILERIGGTARAGSVAPFGRVAGVIGAGDAGRELELRLVGLDDDRVRTASLGKQKDLVRGGAVDVGRAIRVRQTGVVARRIGLAVAPGIEQVGRYPLVKRCAVLQRIDVVDER